MAGVKFHEMSEADEQVQPEALPDDTLVDLEAEFKNSNVSFLLSLQNMLSHAIPRLITW